MINFYRRRRLVHSYGHTGRNTLNSLVITIYGESGLGKTPIAHTSPAPRLILDAENGSKFVKGRKVYWNPLSEAPPEPGEWETCIVHCRDWATFLKTQEWLNSGQHPFRSLVIDSLSELQKRCRDSIYLSGRAQGSNEADEMNERRWGVLLQQMEKGVRELRDLTMHPTRPLECVVLIALTDDKKGKQRPLIQGSLVMSLPGFMDVIGYLSSSLDGARTLAVAPSAAYIAKDRTVTLPPVMACPIDLTAMINFIYQETPTDV